MSSPLTTALTLLVGITLYAAIHSIFNAYYRQNRRIHLYFSLMCLMGCGYTLTRLYSTHSQSVEGFILSQQLGFATAILLFIFQIGFITEYAQWKPYRVIALLIVPLLVVWSANALLPYGIAISVPPKLHTLILPWGETIVDTRIHEKTFWWHICWITIVGVFIFQFAAAFRLRKTGDTQHGNALLWFGGIFFLVVLSNQLVNYYVVKLTQMGEFGFFAMILLISVYLNQDIRSSRQRAESAEIMWSSLVMNAPNFVLLVDESGIIKFINRVIPGDTVEKVIGSHIDDFVSAESQTKMTDSLFKAIADRKAVNTQLQMGPPHNIWLDVHLAPLFVDDRLKHIIVMATDISENIAVRNKLQQSEIRHRQLLQTLPYGVQEIDKQGRITFSNQAHDELFGYESAQILGMPIYEILANEEEVGRLRAYINYVFESHPDPETYTKEVKRKNGELFYTKVDWDYVYDSDGNTVGLLSVLTDITQQYHAEDALRNSAQKYRALMERASDIILMANHAGKLIETNSRGLAVLGYTREEFTRLSIKDVHPPHQLERILQAFQQLVENGNNTLNDTFLLTKKGEELPVDISANLIEYQGDKVAVGFMRDISTRKEHEEQNRQYEYRHREMLVREVHHRIKNNLQGVIGLLRNSMDEEQSSSKQLMASVITQIGTIATVHGIQARYSGDEVLLCDITRAIVDQCRGFAPPNVQVEFQENMTRPGLLCEQEAIPIALVINELVTNAIKHIPDSIVYKQVNIELMGNPSDGMELRVFNYGATLPKELNGSLDDVSGVGLDLVRALLPRQYATFSLTEDHDERGVYACLRFEPELLSEIPLAE